VNDDIINTKLSLQRLIECSNGQNAELFILVNSQKRYVIEYISSIEKVNSLKIHKRFLETNLGVRARNLVINQCAGEYIVLVDNDTVVFPGYLIKFERYINISGIGCVSCFGWFLRVKDNAPDLVTDFRIHPGSFIDVASCSLACYANLREKQDFLLLPDDFDIYGFDDVYYSLLMKRYGLRVCYSGWDNFGIHLGSKIEKGENLLRAYETNKQIIMRDFMDGGKLRRVKLEKQKEEMLCSKS
jgi:glycosyltransferase involved in cell wall biosynthesis